jgi:prepilin-type N-terminal cleavage/methylation domain-containing protein
VTRRRSSSRGFTLIELMVALLISSLLIGMIFAIFLRMSLAYRGQQQIIGVQSNLSAARAWIEHDAKQAGFGMAQGFSIATAPTQLNAPVQVTDSATGPDEIAFYYADPSVQAVVAAPVSGNWPNQVAVDSAAGFADGNLVVMTRATQADSALSDGKIAVYTACVLQIASVSATSITFATTAPWGTANQVHCAAPVAAQTMIYKFVARAYRIDSDLGRAADGVLQLSRTGDLNTAAIYEDIGMGFTDLQVASYFYDNDGSDTADPDTDPNRDWRSGAAQTTLTAPIASTSVFTPMLQVGVSLVARTLQDREGVSTAFTPALGDPPNLDNNMVGNRAAVDLSLTSDPHLLGNRLYRHSTFYVDLRNIGVGR